MFPQVLLCSVTRAGQAPFPETQPSYSLPGFTRAADCSFDGRVFAGTIETDLGVEAYYWTAEEGMTIIGDLPGGRVFALATGISGDGRAIFGYSSSAVTGACCNTGFYWTDTTGMIELGAVPGGSYGSWPYGVSYDGAVMVGVGSVFFGSEAFRWTRDEGLMGLGYLPDPLTAVSLALGVSADGNVVVGTSSQGTSHQYEAFRWSAATGMVGLGASPSIGQAESRATFASADGAIIHGYTGQCGTLTFRWTNDQGMVILGEFGGLKDVSDDGLFLIGHSGATCGPAYGVWIWDDANGIRHVPDLLRDLGLYFQGWPPIAVDILSGDARTLYGAAVNESDPNENQFYVARIPLPGDIFADINGNYRVDAGDVKPLGHCMAGPGEPVTGVCAMAADLDGDGDVDLRDYVEAFQPLFSGSYAFDPDLNGDGVVSGADFAAFAACLGGPGAATACPHADGDLDGDTDLNDFTYLQRAFPPS